MSRTKSINDTTTAPYQCEVELRFPSNHVAQMAKDVLSVDEEVGDKTWKTFSICSSLTHSADDKGSDLSEDMSVLKIHFYGTEAKSLRVSISSFYDLLTVFLKCQQEFGI